MSDFLQLAQSLAVALKALQMYTAAHPRAQQGLAAAHAGLTQWLMTSERLQFVVSGSKLFVDGQVQDTRSPHVSLMMKLVSERGIGGFSFERGLSTDEMLVFLQGLATKPQRLEEQGGFEALFRASGVVHIRVSQVRYQEISEGDESGSGDKAPLFSPAPSPSPDNLVRFIREALLAALAKGATATSGTTTGSGPGSTDEGELGFLQGFGPADLSGLGPLGHELGLGEGMPSPGQLSTLQQVLMGLAPELQMNLLAGLRSLPDHPAGLALGLKALSDEVLAGATSALLAKGTTWPQLKGPIQDILRPISDRDRLVRTLVSHLRATGQDRSPVEAILRQLDWEALSLEAKLLSVLEEGYLFELSLEQRLALLRELLDLRRFDEFLRIQEILLETLSSDRPEVRLLSAQTLAGVARWTLEPGLPPEGEGPLGEALRAHFAWEPDPPTHAWTVEALELILGAMIHRGELTLVISDLQELHDLFSFLDEQQPWRNEALARLRASLQRPQLLDDVIGHAFGLERERMIREVHPYLEFLGDPMARHLVGRLGDEVDRTRRGRLVEAVRSMGPVALPALMDALTSPAWFLVRNALTLVSDLGDAGCVPDILPLLRHPEPRVRRTAVRALWKLGGPVAEPHLVARMKDTDGETLQEILFVLGQLRSEGCLPQVTELAHDKRVVERIRIQALDTLAHIASPKAMPVLLECTRRKGFFGGGEPQPIRLAAAKALAALGTPEAQAALQRVVQAELKGEDRDAMTRLLNRPVRHD